MAFIDWYSQKPLRKSDIGEKKALQCLNKDDDVTLRQLLESGKIDGNVKIQYWSSQRTLFYLALVAHHATKCGKKFRENVRFVFVLLLFSNHFTRNFCLFSQSAVRARL